mmetsp:Transcript_62908/g.124280  ORF Transcript_62908/g.124280 Transcript_62908/m.124280 type:complete len:283 (+) Transcript_62908:188-1036(+)
MPQATPPSTLELRVGRRAGMDACKTRRIERLARSFYEAHSNPSPLPHLLRQRRLDKRIDRIDHLPSGRGDLCCLTLGGVGGVRVRVGCGERGVSGLQPLLMPRLTEWACLALREPRNEAWPVEVMTATEDVQLFTGRIFFLTNDALAHMKARDPLTGCAIDQHGQRIDDGSGVGLALPPRAEDIPKTAGRVKLVRKALDKPHKREQAAHSKRQEVTPDHPLHRQPVHAALHTPGPHDGHTADGEPAEVGHAEPLVDTPGQRLIHLQQPKASNSVELSSIRAT